MRLVKTKLFKGNIHCETGLHIGGSSDEIEIGGVDMTVIKDPVTGEPYIPGSSIKGKMRSSLERAKGFEAYASASSQFIPLPLSACCHISPVASSVTVPSPLSLNLFFPYAGFPRT